MSHPRHSHLLTALRLGGAALASMRRSMRVGLVVAPALLAARGDGGTNDNTGGGRDPG